MKKIGIIIGMVLILHVGEASAEFIKIDDIFTCPRQQEEIQLAHAREVLVSTLVSESWYRNFKNYMVPKMIWCWENKMVSREYLDVRSYLGVDEILLEIEGIRARGDENSVDRLIELLAIYEARKDFIRDNYNDEHFLDKEDENTYRKGSLSDMSDVTFDNYFNIYPEIYKTLCLLKYTDQQQEGIKYSDNWYPDGSSISQSRSNTISGAWLQEIDDPTELSYVAKAQVILTWMEENIYSEDSDNRRLKIDLETPGLAVYRDFFGNWTENISSLYADYLEGEDNKMVSFVNSVLEINTSIIFDDAVASESYEMLNSTHPQILPYLTRVPVGDLDDDMKYNLERIVNYLYKEDDAGMLISKIDDMLIVKYAGRVESMLSAAEIRDINNEDLFGAFWILNRGDELKYDESEDNNHLRALIDSGNEIYLLGQLFSPCPSIREKTARALYEIEGYASFNSDLLSPLTALALFDVEDEKRTEVYVNALMSVLEQGLKYDSLATRGYFDYLALFLYPEASDKFIQDRLGPWIDIATSISEGKVEDYIDYKILRENAMEMIRGSYNPVTVEAVFNAISNVPMYLSELEQYHDHLKEYWRIDPDKASLITLYSLYLQYFDPSGRDMQVATVPKREVPQEFIDEFGPYAPLFYRLGLTQEEQDPFRRFEWNVQESLETAMRNFLLQVTDPDSVRGLIDMTEELAKQDLYWKDREFVAKFLESVGITPKDKNMNNRERLQYALPGGRRRQPGFGNLLSHAQLLEVVNVKTWYEENKDEGRYEEINRPEIDEEKSEKLLRYLIFGPEYQGNSALQLPKFVMNRFKDYVNHNYIHFHYDGFKDGKESGDIKPYLTESYFLPDIFQVNTKGVIGHIANQYHASLATAYTFLNKDEEENIGPEFLLENIRNFYIPSDSELTSLIGRNFNSTLEYIDEIFNELVSGIGEGVSIASADNIAKALFVLVEELNCDNFLERIEAVNELGEFINYIVDKSIETLVNDLGEWGIAVLFEMYADDDFSYLREKIKSRLPETDREEITYCVPSSEQEKFALLIKLSEQIYDGSSNFRSFLTEVLDISELLWGNWFADFNFDINKGKWESFRSPLWCSSLRELQDADFEQALEFFRHISGIGNMLKDINQGETVVSASLTGGNWELREYANFMLKLSELMSGEIDFCNEELKNSFHSQTITPEVKTAILVSLSRNRPIPEDVVSKEVTDYVENRVKEFLGIWEEKFIYSDNPSGWNKLKIFSENIDNIFKEYHQIMSILSGIPFSFNDDSRINYMRRLDYSVGLIFQEYFIEEQGNSYAPTVFLESYAWENFHLVFDEEENNLGFTVLPPVLMSEIDNRM